MDGILIIDKPAGITSHDVVARVRRILKQRRVGHTGTLDPFATGVMVILVGKATRLARFLSNDAKEYSATIRFGYETDTGDLTGKPIDSSGQIVPGDVSVNRIASAMTGFIGEIDQVPPMYSAKKQEGKKLYELAREGREVERDPVRVTIYDLGVDDDSELASDGRLKIHVKCSAGTYVRTLAEDIGRKAGIGAHLIELRRTAAGKFRIESAVTLDDLESSDDPSGSLVALENAVDHLAEFRLPADRVERTRNGLSTRVVDNARTDDSYIRMTSPDTGELIAIGRYDPEENSIRPTVVLG